MNSLSKLTARKSEEGLERGRKPLVPAPVLLSPLAALVPLLYFLDHKKKGKEKKETSRRNTSMIDSNHVYEKMGKCGLRNRLTTLCDLHRLLQTVYDIVWLVERTVKKKRTTEQCSGLVPQNNAALSGSSENRAFERCRSIEQLLIRIEDIRVSIQGKIRIHSPDI